MAYQTLWVIEYQSHPSRKTVVLLFNPLKEKWIHTFPKSICPKVNVNARLEFELDYYDSAAYRFNHYTTRTPPVFFLAKEHNNCKDQNHCEIIVRYIQLHFVV